VVHRVVVDEGGQVDELDERGQRLGARVGLAVQLVAQQHQPGAEELAADLQQVVVDLVHRGEVRHHDAADLVHHRVQAVLDGRVDVGQPDGGGAQRHAVRRRVSSGVSGVDRGTT